jgi:hypothetical protein
MTPTLTARGRVTTVSASLVTSTCVLALLQMFAT